MLIILNLSNLFSLMKPTTRYDLSNICVCVERVMTTCYMFDCIAIKDIAPYAYIDPKYETLIHMELKKVLPILRHYRENNQRFYIDLSTNGSLTLSTEKPRDDYMVYTTTLPSVY